MTFNLKPDIIDIKLSVLLQCPSLISTNNDFKKILSKSGCMRIFELSKINVPIGAWEINSFESMVDNLIFFIKNYPQVKTWIFKMNKETST